MIKVTVWNENFHEKKPEVSSIYPKGIHGAIADFLSVNDDMLVRTATLDSPDQGLPDELLNDTDVLLWWGHIKHGDVKDELVEKIIRRVTLENMGFIALHSAHASKPFQRLMGTPSGMLRWREDGDMQRLWVVSPNHPIAEGIGDYFEVPHDETYGEMFYIPQPENLVFISWHPGGEVFRSGCCFVRGGRIFYFQPGHETFPVYHQKEVQKVITNAVRWAAPKAPAHAYITGFVERGILDKNAEWPPKKK